MDSSDCATCTASEGELTPGQRLTAWALGLVVGLVFLWATVGLLVVGYFAREVPLTKEDLAMASWLGSPTMALHFTSAGFLGPALILTTMLTGVTMGIAKRSVLPMLAASLVCVPMLVAEPSFVRIGLLDGTVRLGCYVPETRECLDMLGLDSEGAPSRYEAGADSAWYAERLKSEVAGVSEWRIVWASFPMGAVMRAPLHMGEADKLRAILQTQRAQVQQFKDAHRLSQSSPQNTTSEETPE